MSDKELQKTLMKFYSVDSKDALIRIQDGHITRLQQRLKNNHVTVPITQLPARENFYNSYFLIYSKDPYLQII